MTTNKDKQMQLVVKAKCSCCGQEEHFYKGSSDRICFDCLIGNINPSQPDAELKTWLLKDKQQSLQGTK